MTEHDHQQETNLGHRHVHADGTDCACETSESAIAGATAIDPVCQMTVEKEGANFIATPEGHNYYFCSADCRSAFEGSPHEYLGTPHP